MYMGRYIYLRPSVERARTNPSHHLLLLLCSSADGSTLTQRILENAMGSFKSSPYFEVKTSGPKLPDSTCCCFTRGAF